jgi:hypothetical protein
LIIGQFTRQCTENRTGAKKIGPVHLWDNQWIADVNPVDHDFLGKVLKNHKPNIIFANSG